MAKIITEAHDEKNSSIPKLKASLAPLAKKSKEVKGYRTEKIGTGAYKVVQFHKKEDDVDKHYTPKEEGIPALDHTGKLHGELPSRDKWTKYSKDDLEILVNDLKKSVKERDYVNKTHPKGLDYGHGKRVADEHQLLREITKHLSQS